MEKLLEQSILTRAAHYTVNLFVLKREKDGGPGGIHGI